MESKMTDEQYGALKTVIEYLLEQIKTINPQTDPNYPYINATLIDLTRMYGMETIARDLDIDTFKE